MTPRGKSTMFRCPLPLRTWLEEEARRRDVSVSRLVVWLLEEAREKQKKEAGVGARQPIPLEDKKWSDAFWANFKPQDVTVEPPDPKVTLVQKGGGETLFLLPNGTMQRLVANPDAAKEADHVAVQEQA